VPKKTGIVAAATIAGMLALSPVALANGSVQPNQVDLCGVEQGVGVLLTALVGPIPPQVAQVQILCR
jgi:hypothetical protein